MGIFCWCHCQSKTTKSILSTNAAGRCGVCTQIYARNTPLPHIIAEHTILLSSNNGWGELLPKPLKFPVDILNHVHVLRNRDQTLFLCFSATSYEVTIPAEASGHYTLRLLRQAAEWSAGNSIYFFKSCGNIDVVGETSIYQLFFIPLAWKAIGGYCDSQFLLCVCRGVYVCMFQFWLDFRYWGLLWKVEVRLEPKLGPKVQWGVPLYVDTLAKVIYQGQGSSKVKLGGKCKLVLFFWKVEVQLQPNLICRFNMWTPYSVSGWGLVKLGFLSYFYASYYDIGVPCKLLPPCQGSCNFTCCIFALDTRRTQWICIGLSHFAPR